MYDTLKYYIAQLYHEPWAYTNTILPKVFPGRGWRPRGHERLRGGRPLPGDHPGRGNKNNNNEQQQLHNHN